MLKTHHCGALRKTNEGEKVALAGWVHRRRDHGGLIFVDLRDHSGLVQVVFNPGDAAAAHAVAQDLRPEYVIQVQGEVAARRPGTENAQLPTGEIEVRASDAVLLNPARTPPFYINEETEVEDLLRLRYRYLDLRREGMHERIVLRHRVVKYIRDFLTERGFIEIETPILANPTPEGARDFLVPSRLQPGSFYALPQSPQQFKQLLMVADFERYFQIARCFRDEDLRADRQPEFTQLDLEMSFVEPSDILDLMEELYATMAQALRPELKVARPFPRLTYEEAMRRFGSDKPDLRYGMELADFTDLVGASEFGVFRAAVESGGAVEGICAPGGETFSRRDIDGMTDLVKRYGAKGLVSIALLEDPASLSAEGFRSPVAKYLEPDMVRAMAARAGAKKGDLLVIVAGQGGLGQKDEGSVHRVKPALDALRRELAGRLGLADPNTLAYAFITDFPLLEWNEEDRRWYAMHHPFTSPRPEDVRLLDSDPGRALAQAYDLVCNGFEIGGGSIRIHLAEVQQKLFNVLGIGPDEQRDRFGHMLDAFTFGAPPHGGIATGIDRTVALLAGEADIREVMTFPKTKTAQDPMTGAPYPVPDESLRDLGIRVTQR